MAVASGGFNLRPFRSDLYVSQGAQSIPGNYSNVAWSLYIVQTGSYDTYWLNNDRYWSVNVDGNVWSGYFSYDFRNYDSLLLAATNLNIGHNADGTRSIGFSSYIDGGDGIGTASASGSMGLTTIPRASTPTLSPSTLDAGTTMTINTNRASSGFTHNITWIFGTQSGSVGTGIGTSTSWTPPLSLLTEIPNAAQGNGTIRTVTYNGSTYIGQTDVTFYLRAPDSTAPTITVPEITDSEAVPLIASTVGKYVQKLSKISVTINSATPQYGATIPSNGYKIEVDGQTINAQTGTTPDFISSSGTIPIKITVTDSRGKARVVTKNISVLPWAVPLIDLNGLSIIRSNSAGVPQEDGTYIKVHLKGSVSSLVNGTEKNALSYQILTRPRGGSTWTTALTITPGGVTIDADLTPISPYAPESAWDVRVDLKDKFATSTTIGTIAVGQVFIHFGQAGQGVGFGKFWERGAIDALGKIYSTDMHYVLDGRVTLEGTTAQRNAIFGDPGSTAGIVALANLQPVWYNTDYGWWEIYLAATGMTGLTVRGVFASAPVGWYPLGPGGPRARIEGNGTGQAMTNYGEFSNYRAFATSLSTDSFDSMRNYTGFTRATSSSLASNLWGYYNLVGCIYVPNGSGTGVVAFSGYRPSTSNYAWDIQQAAPLLPNNGQLIRWNLPNTMVQAGDRIFLRSAQGSWTIGGGLTFIDMQYISPPYAGV